MAKITGKYEVLYIIDPAQGEEGIAALVEKFKAMVEAEGTVSNVDEWGKRRLAYPINDLAEESQCSETAWRGVGSARGAQARGNTCMPMADSC